MPVEVVNRDGGNGTVQKIKAAVTFEDGSTQEFAGGEYDSFQARYAFGLSAENKGKKATKVEITPLEASGDQMLTLREINFNYTQGVEAIEVSSWARTRPSSLRATLRSSTLRPRPRAPATPM